MHICKVNNCDKSAERSDHGRLGLCRSHYYSYNKYGDPLIQKKARDGEWRGCKIDDCNNSYHAKGYCLKHANSILYREQNNRRNRIKRAKYGRGDRKRLLPLLIARDGATCRFCGTTSDLTVDRIFPGKYGGEYRLDNCQLLCVSCNSRKSAKWNLFAFAKI